MVAFMATSGLQDYLLAFHEVKATKCWKLFKLLKFFLFVFNEFKKNLSFVDRNKSLLHEAKRVCNKFNYVMILGSDRKEFNSK